MLASIAIALLSLAMLLYWFRYTCLLLLKARQTHDFARPVIDLHGLTFRGVSHSDTADEIDRRLQRDFEILNGLISRISSDYAFEVLLLRVDYGIMRVWWRFTYGRSPRCASAAGGW